MAKSSVSLAKSYDLSCGNWKLLNAVIFCFCNTGISWCCLAILFIVGHFELLGKTANKHFKGIKLISTTEPHHFFLAAPSCLNSLSPGFDLTLFIAVFKLIGHPQPRTHKLFWNTSSIRVSE